VAHRFEELAYADDATYMEAGRVVCSGPAADVAAHLRTLGATL
jgi:ABC-type branched-subunit amino acid transport system ATPase component